MAQDYFATSSNPGAGVVTWRLSGWGPRAYAAIVDGIIVLMPVFIAGVMAGLTAIPDEPSGLDDGELTAILVTGLTFPVVYYCWMMSATNGQTVGKRALKIRVVREDGQPVTAGFAFRREVIVIGWLFGGIGGAFLFGLPQVINYLWPLWDDNRQALHDKIVKSRVVLAEPVAAAVPSTPQPLFPIAPTAQPGAPPPAPPAQPTTAAQRYTGPPTIPVPWSAPTAPPRYSGPSTPQPPTPPPPPSPPTPPNTGAMPYTPPPGFDNPVPEDRER